MTDQWKRPPVEPTGASHDWLVDAHDTGRTTPPSASDLPEYDPKRGRAVYRVRWWRTGWRHGEQSANSRYYMTQLGALRCAEKLRNAPITDHGPIHVEVDWSPRERWRPVEGPL